jgi:predicted dehydrogenase
MNDMIRVAILGAGSRGIELLRAFDGLAGCMVAAAVDPNLSRLLYVQEWFPHVAVTAVDGTVLHDPSVSVVVVAAPLDIRPALATAALAAGKHVLVNGRLAADGQQAAELVALAAKQGKVLAASHELVYHPAVQEMKTVLELGRLGELCYLESARQRPVSLAHEPDAIWGMMALDVAVALYLAGEQPVRVQAVGRDFTPAGQLDVVFMTVHYESGRFSQHHVSTLSPQRSHRCQVVGREGAMVFNEERTAEVLRVYTAAGLPGSQGAVKAATAVMEYDLNDLVFASQESAIPLVRQCSAFLEAVCGRQPLAADGALGRELVQVLDAAERSVREGGTAVELG